MRKRKVGRDKQLFQSICRKGTKYSFTGHTALHWASAKGHLECVSWLLAEGRRVGLELVTCTNHSDATPLHSAASNGRAEAAMLLLNAGADPDVKDDCDESPLEVRPRSAPARPLRSALLPASFLPSHRQFLCLPSAAVQLDGRLACVCI